MELELRNIKYSSFASQETPCYEAKLYLNNKPLALIRNEGSGGSDYQLEHPAFTRSDFRKNFFDVLRDVDKYFSDQPKIKSKFKFADDVEPKEYELTMDLELWCHQELNKWKCSKTLRRNLNKGSMIQDADGEMYQWKKHIASDVILKHHPKAVILNDLPFEKALTIFMALDE